MNAKEKAEELVSKFHVEIMDFTITDVVLEDTSKTMALIAVNEIISALVGLGPISYWVEVENEIEKL